MSNEVTDDDMGSLRHMLGAVSHYPKSKWGYRNYYAAGLGAMPSMERLEKAGFVTRGSQYNETGFYFHATEAGMDAIGLSKAAKRRAFEP